MDCPDRLSCRGTRTLRLSLLRRSPQGDATQGGVRGLETILPFGLETLGDGLASRQGNQAGEDDLAAGLAFDGVSAHAQILHLLIQRSPVLAS